MMLNPVLILIGINFLVFIAVNISSGLVINLGLWSPVDAFFQYPWGLATSMFVHREIFHIFANMLTLYFFGSFLIRLVGDRWFWVIYLGGGILGGIFFVALGTLADPDSLILAIGASGAVFALAGTLVILAPRLRVYIFPIPVPVPLWIAVIGGFLLISFFPNVAWQAHLGGLLFGMAAAYYIKRRGRRYYF
jgi:membrane associated rhomboid family serine protease